MFTGLLWAADSGGWVKRRATRFVTVVALFASLFVVAQPEALAVDFTVSFVSAESTTPELGTHEVDVIINTAAGVAGADIIIDVIDTFNGDADGDDYSPAITRLTFPAGSGDGVTQPATIDIIPDATHEADETIELQFIVFDPGDDVVTPAGELTHTVTINDGDPGSISFSDPASTTAAESGTHTTTVELSVPGGGNLVSDVTVDVIEDPTGTADAADYTLTTTSVTFAAGTADEATRNVNLAIATDDIDEGDETIDLSLAANSGPGVVSGTHEVTIEDDDTAGVTVSIPFTTVTEGDLVGVPYTVVLTSEPTNNVRIEATPAGLEAAVSPQFQTFNSNNWDEPKGFVITAVDDLLLDGETADQILHNPISTDANYGAIPIPPIAVTVQDNEEAPVANPDFYNVDEGGTLTTDALDGVRSNDTPDPLDLTVTLVTPPDHHVGLFTLDPNGSFEYIHDGSGPPTDTFTYFVTDGLGNDSAAATVTITIDNVAPVVTAGDDIVVAEEDPVDVNAVFTDPGLGDTHTATIDWGDGTVDDCSTDACDVTFSALTGVGAVTGSHSYGAAAVYSVTVSVDDGDDAGSDSLSVQVDNANLTVIVAADPDAINEGAATSVSATFDDSDNRGAHVALVDWGDGTVDDCATPACTIVDNGDGTGTVAGTHTYDDDGSFTVTVNVSDPSGDEGSGGASVAVANVAPIVEITNKAGDPLPTSSNGGQEGVLLKLRSSIVDPGAEDFTYDWKIRLLGQVVASSTNSKLNYTPTEDGTYFVSLNVNDGDGGSDADSALIIIRNATPVITQIDFDATPPIGASVPMAVHFVDGGTSDTHVTTVSWGEGPPEGKPGASPRSFGHTYPSAGTRSALVCVSDDDGGEACESFYVNPGVTFSIDSDFDGNGYEDLPIGVPGENGFGAVSVLYATNRGLRAAADDMWRQGLEGIAQVGEAGDGFGSVLAWGDFNLDGYADLAAAAPTEDISGVADAGLVHVIPGSANGLTATGDRVFHQDSTGILGSNQPGDRFGAALTTGDFNGDGFADLAIGVPGEDIGGLLNTGRVAVLFGSPDGLTAAGDESWDQDKPGVVGSNRTGADRGEALTAGDFDRDGFWDLAIGVPGNATSGVRDSGAVLILGGWIGGLDAGADQWWTQNTPTIVDKAQRGDRFGSVLETGDFNGDNRADLAIGIPREGVAGKSKAGAVAVLLGSGGGLTAVGNTIWSEATTGILGDIKRNDRFGFALTAGDFDADGRDDLAIGIPYQEIGARKDAGDVAVIYGGAAGLQPTGDQRWNEATPGVKGGAAKYDHLGWALRAFDERADNDGDLVIGIPDQNVAGIGNAGAVLVLKGRSGGITAAGDSYWHQNTTGIRGEPGVADKFGKAL